MRVKEREHRERKNRENKERKRDRQREGESRDRKKPLNAARFLPVTLLNMNIKYTKCATILF